MKHDKSTTLVAVPDVDLHVDQADVEEHVMRAFHSAGECFDMNRRNRKFVDVDALMALSFLTTFPPDATVEQLTRAILTRRLTLRAQPTPSVEVIQ